ncbi:epoxide hydrolase [Niveomyces insectorum RCEF 264]|uniref:Epoxide hydrolase n=1 Tax=Niveomyces insectorum RCEF 264 TaxID=1081102 RepID=A0A168AD21_9HYPO|nr:epoxide hydrolase [Niveomyces insectorum RCEF 264]
MDTLVRKTVVTQRKLKYTYYVSPTGQATKDCPALFFVHGFPDSAQLWSDVIDDLRGLPNKIIVPDCLGYGGTDKPDDINLYAYQDQANDLIDILRNEQAADGGAVVGIGHDWGSMLVPRTYLHHRGIFCGMALFTGGYLVPTAEPFDLDGANTFTEKILGYPQLAYWEFFTAPDAGDVIDRHLDRMWMVLHGAPDGWMKAMFCEKGAIRRFLLGDQQVPLRPFAQTPRRKEYFLQQFSPANGGFGPALQMYKAMYANVQMESDKMLLKDSLVIDVPFLHAVCTGDAVSVPETMIAQAKAMNLVPKLKEVVIDSGHWCPMENPQEVAEQVRQFLLNELA